MNLLFQFCEVPSDYDEVYLEMARRGARVLALGYKKLGVLSHQQVRNRTNVYSEGIKPTQGFSLECAMCYRHIHFKAFITLHTRCILKMLHNIFE